ncbi:MAG: N-formylglutamate amidohydrolase, partial [Pirellulales bacterium]
MRLFELTVGDGPLVAAAIHHGHELRSDVAKLIALDEAERLREEDPFTDELAALAPTRLVGQRSRFEVDLNRPRKHAVYQRPEDAWGLDVWRETLPPCVVAESLANYDLCYAVVHALVAQLIGRYGRVVVLDLHSYNHCREGSGSAADATENPEVNIGTGSLDRTVWAPVVERFMTDLRAFDYFGRQLEVRENVKFFGGHFPKWIHATFPEQACVIAVEFKKTFMDEWTGELDRTRFDAIKAALQSTLPGILAVLDETGVGARTVA